MNVLCIGHASYDLSVIIKEFPKENTKYRFDNITKCGGGPACNAAYLLGKWGVETYFAGVVGNDTFGSRIKKELESVNVNINNVEVNYEVDTSISLVLSNPNNGSRTLFNLQDNRPEMSKYHYEVEPDVILTDGNDYKATMAAFNRFPKAIKIIDAGRITKELMELCLKVDFIVCSKGFAEAVSKMTFDYKNNKSMANLYNELKRVYNTRTVIVTLEDKGVLYGYDGNIKLLPALDVKEVDTTGAGDIFHGAFTYAIAKNMDVEKAIKIANITAGLSVAKMGARYSIPEVEEVMNILENKKDINKIDNDDEKNDNEEKKEDYFVIKDKEKREAEKALSRLKEPSKEEVKEEKTEEVKEETKESDVQAPETEVKEKKVKLEDETVNMNMDDKSPDEKEAKEETNE